MQPDWTTLFQWVPNQPGITSDEADELAERTLEPLPKGDDSSEE
jgi:hypothetical protein